VGSSKGSSPSGSNRLLWRGFSMWAAAWTSSVLWSISSPSSFSGVGVPSVVSHPLTLLLSLFGVFPLSEIHFPRGSTSILAEELSCALRWVHAAGTAMSSTGQSLASSLQPPALPLPPNLDSCPQYSCMKCYMLGRYILAKHEKKY